MAQFLLPLAMGVPGLIGGIMEAVRSGKRLTGGRLIVYKHMAKAPHGGRIRRVKRHRRGRGIAADIAGAIPLLGAFAGPLVRAMGGKLRRKRVYRRRKGGDGLVPMHMYNPIAYGSGLLFPGRRHMIGGLLSPTGGAVSYRKGYYKHVKGRRIHVKPAIVHHGGRIRRAPRRKIYHRRM
jgi:hypothetical protein